MLDLFAVFFHFRDPTIFLHVSFHVDYHVPSSSNFESNKSHSPLAHAQLHTRTVFWGSTVPWIDYSLARHIPYTFQESSYPRRDRRWHDSQTAPWSKNPKKSSIFPYRWPNSETGSCSMVFSFRIVQAQQTLLFYARGIQKCSVFSILTILRWIALKIF